MILRTIICSKCGASEQEKGPNIGWPGWGHVAGVGNPETGETVAHICPTCKSEIVAWLQGTTLTVQFLDLDKGAEDDLDRLNV